MDVRTEIEKAAQEILTDCMDDYAARIWDAIKDDVIADVLECTDAGDGGGFTSGDVKLAIGRCVARGLCLSDC